MNKIWGQFNYFFNVCDNFKTKNNYKEVFKILLNTHIEKVKKEVCVKILNPNLFSFCLPKIYKFIDLPELAIGLNYQIYDKRCEICNQKGRPGLLYLFDGLKVYFRKECVAERNGEKVDSVYIHTKSCGFCRFVFYQTYFGEVLFSSSNNYFKKFIPIYENEFGETIPNSNFGKETKLNKEKFKKVLKIFNESGYSGFEKET